MSSLPTHATPTDGVGSYFKLLLACCNSTQIETTIVAVILTFFYLFKQRTASKSRLEDYSSPLACRTKSTPSRSWKYSKADDTQQVQKFVTSITGKGFRLNSGVLKKYDNLVRDQGVRLNEYITDLQQARSFYISLIATSLKTRRPSVEESGKGCTLRQAGWTFRLLSDMRKFGFPRSVEFYALVIKLHAQEQLYQEVFALHEEMEVDGISADSGLYICLLNWSVECHDQRAWYFFQKLCELGSPSLRTYMTMLRGCAHSKDWQGAVQMLENMHIHGILPDNLVLNNVLALCVSVGQVHVAESLLPKYSDIIDVITCNTVLKGYAHQADLPKAEALLERMLAEGPAPNVITFNTIMDCAVRVIQTWDSGGKRTRGKDSGSRNMPAPSTMPSIRILAQKPWEFLNKMSKLKLEPDRYTVSTIVKGMHMTGGSANEIERAVELVRDLGPAALRNADPKTLNPRDSNVRLVEVLFNTLLDICCASRNLDRMTEIFGLMQEYSVETSTVTFGTLIKAFGQAGRLDRCREVWKQMRDLNLQPTVVTFGCYIDACVRNEDVQSALDIFNGMIAEQIEPNAVIYTSLIRGFAAASEPVQAFQFYRKMRQQGVQPLSATFNNILDTLARQLANTEQLQEVLKDMSDAGVAPDAVTYTILIKASCNASDVHNALALYNRARKTGIVFDQVAFNMVLLACSKADRVTDAEEIFQDMLKHKLMPSMVTASILVNMYGRAQLPDKAASVFDFIKSESGEKPNLFAYTCLLQAFAQNGKVRQSWETFDRMILAGLAPDAVSYGTVINSCLMVDAFDPAMSLIRHAYMWPQKLASVRNVHQDADGWCPNNYSFPLHVIEVQEPVYLTSELMIALHQALYRKEQWGLLAELEEVMAQQTLT